jgi:hypothetical protein
VQARQDGFKAHVAVEPDTGIITDCALTKASGHGTDGQPVSEARTGVQLLEAEDSPVTVLADSAYGSGEFRAELAQRGHVDLVKPAPIRPAVQGGFTVDDFAVDDVNGTITCPAGITRTISSHGRATFKSACGGCLLRERCTTSVAGRIIRIRPHDALQKAARRNARNAQWQHEYRRYRPMVERAISWLVRGNRKVRYRGVAKNDHWLHHRAAALNLRRLITLGLTHNGTAWALT